jgi:hypothetical protein
MSIGLFMDIGFCYNDFVEFSDWITKKFVEWRGERFGQSASIAEFAKVFGASQPLMSEWMKKGGKIPKSKKYVDALIQIYGDEVYEILGFQKSEEDILKRLPPERAARMRAALNEVNNALQAAGEIPEEEAARITDEIMLRHGWSFKES